MKSRYVAYKRTGVAIAEGDSVAMVRSKQPSVILDYLDGRFALQMNDVDDLVWVGGAALQKVTDFVNLDPSGIIDRIVEMNGVGTCQQP